jgi:hypothetical protein
MPFFPSQPGDREKRRGGGRRSRHLLATEFRDASDSLSGQPRAEADGPYRRSHSASKPNLRF